MNVEGQRLLTEAEEHFRSFVYMPNEHYYTLTALWVAHANMYDIHGTFIPYQTPRLYFGSIKPGCGKTLTGEIVTMLCGGKMMLQPTVPGMVSSINNGQPVLFDEFDKYSGTGRGSDKMFAIINGGYKRGGVVTKTVREQPVDQNIHGPMILTGKNLELLLKSDAFDTVRDRSHIVALEKMPGDMADDFVEYEPEYHEAMLRETGHRFRKWGERHARRICQDKPDIPAGIHGRAKELWKNMFQIAQYVGGEWPERAERAARAITLGMDDAPRVQSPSDELLKYARLVFGNRKSMTSAELTAALFALPGDHWWKGAFGEASERARQLRVSGQLKTHGITSTVERDGDQTHRVYRRRDLFNVTSYDRYDVTTDEESEEAYGDVIEREPVELD